MHPVDRAPEAGPGREPRGRTRVVVRRGSLIDGDESVLVNASNTLGELGAGVSMALRKACGPQLQVELRQALQAGFHGKMPPGEVLVTTAGLHPRARWACHVAVMDYRKGIAAAPRPSLDVIEAGCDRLWQAVETLPDVGRHRIAMVALGAGTGGREVEEVTRVAAASLRRHTRNTGHTRIEGVTFFGYHPHEFEATARAVRSEFSEVEVAAVADPAPGGRWRAAR